MRRAGSIDANQPEIVFKLRDLPGVTVTVLSGVGNGCPDLAVGFRRATFFLEVKDPSKPRNKRKLTPDQVRWHREWRGHAVVVETFEDACEAIGYPISQSRVGTGNSAQSTPSEVK